MSISLRRKFKHLHKAYQRCQGNHAKALEVNRAFLEETGIQTIYATGIPIGVCGNALARIGRRAKREGYYIDSIDFYANRADLRNLPFYKVVEKTFVQKLSITETRLIVKRKDSEQSMLLCSEKKEIP